MLSHDIDHDGSFVHLKEELNYVFLEMEGQKSIAFDYKLTVVLKKRKVRRLQH